MDIQIGIIGLGRVGSALAPALDRAGWKVSAVYDESQERRNRMPPIRGCRVLKDMDQLPGRVSVWFLTVADDDIQNAATCLKAGLRRSGSLIVAHCSGAHSADLLACLRGKNTGIASVHPLQSLSDFDQWQRLYNIFYALEGDATALDVLTSIFSPLGRVVTLSREDKPLYHLACVIASNFFVVLEDMAFRLLERMTGDKAKAADMLYPLISTSLENIRLQGTSRALTGPFVRGDVSILEKHVAALPEQFPELRNIYLQMGQWALKMAAEQSETDLQKLNRMEKELECLQKRRD
ncbi:DUF2520 domain-containing protein [candidate division KSB1 bacterium]|nr:DUF2520 domain-containing protein [candidate division KSB1 bacterium]